MNIDEYKGVFVFIEQLDGHAMGVGYELIGEATKLAAARNTQVTAVVLGHKIGGLAQRLAEQGADKVTSLYRMIQKDI